MSGGNIISSIFPGSQVSCRGSQNRIPFHFKHSDFLLVSTVYHNHLLVKLNKQTLKHSLSLNIVITFRVHNDNLSRFIDTKSYSRS